MPPVTFGFYKSSCAREAAAPGEIYQTKHAILFFVDDVASCARSVTARLTRPSVLSGIVLVSRPASKLGATKGRFRDRNTLRQANVGLTDAGFRVRYMAR